MNTPRLILLTVAMTLLGCVASSVPTSAPSAPLGSASSRADAVAPAAPAPTLIAGGGPVTVEAEPSPDRIRIRRDPAGGPGPDQASIVAETKRLRDRSRACITIPGALRTGRVVVTIAPDGHADHVVVKGHLENTPEGGCVATAFKDFRVAPFPGAPVVVKMSISLP